MVLGAGPSGLACAWALARAGHAVTVLEREPHAGGLCATYAKDGFRFDLGGHRLVTGNAELTRRVEELLGDDLLVQERRSVVLHGGREFRYPLDARDLVRSLGLGENLRAFGGYVRARALSRVRPSPDRTFEEWVASRFGRPLYDTFFGPYTEKLWGIPPQAISADWAAQRIGLLHLGDAALRMVGARKTPIRTYARRYRYPRHGMGELFDKIAEAITALGGRIVLGAEARGLELDHAGRVRAVRAATGEGEIEIPCAAVYTTMPLPDLARTIAPREAEIERAAARLRFRALRFLNIFLARPRVSPNTWMYVADPRFRTARIQEPKQRSLAMAPPGKTSLMLELPCDAGDDLWSLPEEELLELGLGELDALGLKVRSDVLGAFSVRVAHGYPVYHLDYERDRKRLLARVGAVPNLRTGGRQGLFRYVFLDAAMEMGELAATELVASAGADASSGPRASRLDAVRRENALLEIQAITAS